MCPICSQVNATGRMGSSPNATPKFRKLLQVQKKVGFSNNRRRSQNRRVAAEAMAARDSHIPLRLIAAATPLTRRSHVVMAEEMERREPREGRWDGEQREVLRSPSAGNVT